MKIKRFNQVNEEIGNPKEINDIKLDKFVKEVEDYINTDYEEGEEPSNVDMLDEVGELMNKYELTTADLQQIVDEHPDSWEIQTYVKPQLDYDREKEEKDNKVFRDIDAILVNHNLVSDNTTMNKAIVAIIKYFENKR